MEAKQYSAAQLNLLNPDELAELALGGEVPEHKREKFKAAAKGGSIATPTATADDSKPRYSAQALAEAGLSGHRFDFAGKLVDPRGAQLGQVA